MTRVWKEDTRVRGKIRRWKSGAPGDNVYENDTIQPSFINGVN